MANMFNEDGTYNKTNWKAGDKITAGKLNKIEESLEAINNNDISRHVEADTRLDALEEQAAGQNEVTNERIEELNDLVLDNKDELDLAIYDINSRMTFLEEELNEGIDEVHNVAETVDGKIAAADASMKAQVDAAQASITEQVETAKAEMDAMVDTVEGELERRLLYDIFPSDDILDTLDIGTIFEVKGFYTVGDIPKTVYKKLSWANNAINKSGYCIQPVIETGNTLYLPSVGIAQGADNCVINSEILSNVNIAFGALLVLPAGSYYFNNTIDLKSKQLSLSGESMSFTPDTNTRGVSVMNFPNLLDGESAIIAGTGSISNIIIRGDGYEYDIDRSKTYIDKDNIEIEACDKMCYGISGGAITSINNVQVSKFYYGAKFPTNNVYITNFYARNCHIGLSIGGDTKCKGIYGWNIHTLLEVNASLSSAIQVRADSCHHLVNILGGNTKGVYLSDLDADYCLGSVIRFGDGVDWHTIDGITINGVTGRHCCYNAYDETIDDVPTSNIIENIEDVSKWAFISTEKYCSLYGANIIVLTDINANPLDATSNYRTPPILFAQGSGQVIATFTTHILNDYTGSSINITKESLCNTFGLFSGNAMSAQIRINMPSGTYYIRKPNPNSIVAYKESITELE